MIPSTPSPISRSMAVDIVDGPHMDRLADAMCRVDERLIDNDQVPLTLGHLIRHGRRHGRLAAVADRLVERGCRHRAG